jgi:hypothetical protein
MMEAVSTFETSSISTRLHGATSQKTAIFILVAVITWNHLQLLFETFLAALIAGETCRLTCAQKRINASCTSFRYYFPILTKIWICRQIFVKIPAVKLLLNLSAIFECGQAELAKLIGEFFSVSFPQSSKMYPVFPNNLHGPQGILGEGGYSVLK